jgi:hypothetical protein
VHGLAESVVARPTSVVGGASETDTVGTLSTVRGNDWVEDPPMESNAVAVTAKVPGWAKKIDLSPGKQSGTKFGHQTADWYGVMFRQ